MDEIDAGEDIRPLVGGAHLKVATVFFIQRKIIEPLQERVREFRVGDALVRRGERLA